MRASTTSGKVKSPTKLKQKFAFDAGGAVGAAGDGGRRALGGAERLLAVDDRRKHAAVGAQFLEAVDLGPGPARRRGGG